MALIIRKSQTELADSPKLAKIEWELAPKLRGIPEWQWLVMLNYEYARCYKSVVDAVKLLKENPNVTQNQIPLFARYLARQFPEFPQTPWSKILPEKRIERLARIGITKDTNFYFTKPAWQGWGLCDPEVLMVTENPTKLDCGLFQLDFARDDRSIISQFSAWLPVHRATILNQAEVDYQTLKDKLPEGSQQRATDAYEASKLDKKIPPVVGREHKKRRCQDYLKALGGLRALQYWITSENAEIYTAAESPKARPIYVGDHSWCRAKIMSGVMLMRLAIAWNRFSLPFDPFEPKGTDSFNYPQELRKVLPTYKNITTDRKEKAIQFLTENFTLDQLETS